MFESFKKNLPGDKILIELSSANSGGVSYNSDDYIKEDAEKHWSLCGYVKLIKTNSVDTNDNITKKISGSNDFRYFGKDYGYYDKSFKFKEQKIDDMGLNNVLSEFKSLPIDSKLDFFEKFIEENFLVVRRSYIYKVIDRSEMIDFIESIKFFFNEYK